MNKIIKRKSIIVIFVTVVYVFLIFIRYLEMHYDYTKPNIFEIPLTETINNIDENHYTCFYFVQKQPKTEEQLKSMMLTYMSENEIIARATDKGYSDILINFMAPSYMCPIWFQQNKNPYEMDDFIENYIQTNRIAYISCDLKHGNRSIEYVIDDLFFSYNIVNEFISFIVKWINPFAVGIMIAIVIDMIVATICKLNRKQEILFILKVNIVSRLTLYAGIILITLYMDFIVVWFLYLPMELILLIIKLIIYVLYYKRNKINKLTD